jgi:hypothetical protein
MVKIKQSDKKWKETKKDESIGIKMVDSLFYLLISIINAHNIETGLYLSIIGPQNIKYSTSIDSSFIFSKDVARWC